MPIAIVRGGGPQEAPASLDRDDDPQALPKGVFTLDPASREFSNGSVTRRISPRAQGVLVVLAEAKGAVVRRTCLLEAVWSGLTVGDESLTQAVAELRRAFGERRGSKRFIETVQKSGYRLTAPVRIIGQDTENDPAGDSIAALGSELPLESHLAVIEAWELERLHGYQATQRVKELMDNAAAGAPRSACVQAEYAILVGCTILHRGDRPQRLEAAMVAAERALALRPDFVKALRAHGFIAGALGQVEKCRRSFEEAFAREPGDGETHLLAAQAFFGLGATQTALLLAERASGLDPDNFIAPYIAARAALSIGDRARVTKAAQICLTRTRAQLLLTPDLGRAATVQSAALAMLGRSDEALETLARLPSGEPHFCTSVALADAGEHEAALDVLEDLSDAGWHGAGWLTRDPVHRTLASHHRYNRSGQRFGFALDS